MNRTQAVEPLERTAAGIADALLAGPWETAALVARVRAALDRSGPWVGELVHVVQLEYPDPPADRPRELTRFLSAAAPLRRTFAAARAAGRPAPAVRHRTPSPTRMSAGADIAVPAWPTTTALANHLGLTLGELDWFADTQSREQRAGQRLRHYRYRTVPKPRGGLRLLESPKWQLRELQRRILYEVLDQLPLAAAAHGFRPGRSVRSHAGAHVAARCVIRLDLDHFFDRVGAGRVWGVFRLAGYPEQVAYTLTGLVTNATPAAERRPLGPAGAWLGGPHLPQGAPTSPALANLVSYRLDRRLAGLAASLNARYTRYADDLAFSGDAGLLARAPHVLALVGRIAAQEGFAVNPAKTAVVGSGTRQQLTGVVVNERLNVPRADYDRLRATLHNCATHGPAGQDRLGHRDFRAHLLGRISWVASLNPDRGRRLRALFDRIDWGVSGR